MFTGLFAGVLKAGHKDVLYNDCMEQSVKGKHSIHTGDGSDHFHSERHGTRFYRCCDVIDVENLCRRTKRSDVDSWEAFTPVYHRRENENLMPVGSTVITTS